MKSALRRHLRRHGCIRPKAMEKDPNTPDPVTYRARFGSLDAACARIGHTYVARLRLHPELRGTWTREAILEAVRRCHRERGHISARILNADPSLPCVRVVSRMFGGLIACYDAAGIPLTPAQDFWKDWSATRTAPQQIAPPTLSLGPITAGLVSLHTQRQVLRKVRE